MAGKVKNNSDEMIFVNVIKEKQDEINELRLHGVTAIAHLKNENANVRRNKQLDPETKRKIINKNNENIDKAIIVKKKNAVAIQKKVSELSQFIKEKYNEVIQRKRKEYAEKKVEFKNELKVKEDKLKLEYTKQVETENSNYSKLQSPNKEAIAQHNSALKDARILFNDNLSEVRNNYKEKITKLKDEIHLLEVDKYNALDDAYDKRLPIGDKVTRGLENYKFNFNYKSFLLNNGLYITIVLLLIMAIIYYAALTGSFLFNLNTILLIFNQVSPKMFLALGVAGLIVLAGTDLSIGRMVGLGAVITGMLVTTTGETSLKIFDATISFVGIPLVVRVIMAFLFSIIACSIVSGIAGFFVAKFRMHPFISTLATQLMTFGLLAYVTGNSFTGNPDPVVKDVFTGTLFGVFPVMIIYAVLGIVVMWFIWNKTKFGKNMFAVGGNAEAASVSGISVFWVTLGVFILAGIYYGIGSSIYGIYTGNVRAQTGQGMEADAIAACVVGGVSFSGGVGKISGVVIGAVLFQAISVILPFVGITDANFQLAIKGFIILAAVTLDCAKYLKKK